MNVGTHFIEQFLYDGSISTSGRQYELAGIKRSALNIVEQFHRAGIYELFRNGGVIAFGVFFGK